MKAVILAGGKGTRLGSLTEILPKPLVCIGRKPVLEHQIELLKKYSITDIILLIGHLSHKIKIFFGDGSRWGVNITYIEEDEPAGTAGALRSLTGRIDEDFLLFSGDIMMNFDIGRFIAWHKSKQGSIATALVHPSDHPFDSDLVEVDKYMKIIAVLTRPHLEQIFFRNLSIAAVFIFSPEVLAFIPKTGKHDFEKHVLPSIINANKFVYAYSTPEYLRDVGTPERLESVNADYKTGTIHKRTFSHRRPAIFLDRDGVINKRVDNLSNIQDFNLYDFAADSIKKINKSCYLCIVITNQPMIAKGFLTETALDAIHKKMETELGRDGAKIDAIYYCPHHPELGFAGEISELKIACKCRKPDIGMIEKAGAEFNIDLEKSYMIGDSTCDAKAAENAGLNFIGVKTGQALQDEVYKVPDVVMLPSLSEAVDYILLEKINI